MERERETIRNFGRNIHFQPEFHAAPTDEAALLELMRGHQGRKLRAYASLHAWSPVAVCEEVAINLRHFQTVEIHAEGSEPFVIVGGGCPIKRLLNELNQAGWTLPSVGLITEQTVAGATSTGTHGSGRHSLSHYIQAVRLASYDAAGNPVIREIRSGPELQAARCGLGCLGIIVSITLPIRPQYRVEEHFRKYGSLTDVLAAEAEYPIQQFYLVPWNGSCFAQHRRESDQPRSRTAPLYRLYWIIGMDRGFHWIILSLARWLPDRLTPFFFRRLLPLLVPRRWRVVDRSDKQLTMAHHLFRHIETEVFVQRSQLADMLSFTEWLLDWSAGGRAPQRAEWKSRVQSPNLQAELDALRGRFRHHYPICIRKVLTDDTLISMASGGGAEPWYAVSFICYARPTQREGFFLFTNLLITLTAQLFQARPHWGKHLPLPFPEADKLYPRFAEFLEIRQQFDPTGAFLPEWMEGRE